MRLPLTRRSAGRHLRAGRSRGCRWPDRRDHGPPRSALRRVGTHEPALAFSTYRAAGTGPSVTRDPSARRPEDLRDLPGSSKGLTGFAMPAASAPNRVKKLCGSNGSMKLTTSPPHTQPAEHVGDLGHACDELCVGHDHLIRTGIACRQQCGWRPRQAGVPPETQRFERAVRRQARQQRHRLHGRHVSGTCQRRPRFPRDPVQQMHSRHEALLESGESHSECGPTHRAARR